VFGILRFAVALSVLAGIAVPESLACSLPTLAIVEAPDGSSVNSVPSPPEPPPTPEQIADSLPEVVIEGVVIERDPISGEPGATTDTYSRHARMRVDQVWKGEAAKFITLQFGEDTAMCQQVPPVGKHIRISPHPVAPNVFAYDVLSIRGPGDPTEDAGLQLYRDRTIAMQHRAEVGGPVEQRAFADYLHRYGEIHRALWWYESWMKQKPLDLDAMGPLAILQAKARQKEKAAATLKLMRQLAPRTEEWRGKIARATFEATGQFMPDWNDWSDLTRPWPCEGPDGNLDNANFDRSDLSGCKFGQISFRNASFLHADLSYISFASISLAGAKYDCATKLPDDFDPAKEGMINVEGQCPKP